MHTIIVTRAIIAIVVYVIGRQLPGEPRGKRLIALPAILTREKLVAVGGAGGLARRHDLPWDYLATVKGGPEAAKEQIRSSSAGTAGRCRWPA